MTVFADGPANTPGCRCKPGCEFPCWQRVGIGPPCEDCRCPSDLFPLPDEPPPVADLDDARASRRGMPSAQPESPKKSGGAVSREGET